jgi:hypothetical protein
MANGLWHEHRESVCFCDLLSAISNTPYALRSGYGSGWLG